MTNQPLLATGDPETDELLVLTAALLAESLDLVTPPARVKDRLMQSIADPAAKGHSAHPAGLGAIRSHERAWRPTQFPGVSYKKLYFDKQAGLVTNLVKMEPGSVYPAHRHSRTEQCLVLEGDLIHDDYVYGPGDFTWAVAGSLDPELRTEHGNLLLIIGAPGDEILA
jgi:anti-sigma factor ChrR (cupin superfamily)